MSLSSIILISLRTELETDYSGIRSHLIFKKLTISQMTFDERCPIRNNNLKLSKLILRIFIKSNGFICPTKIPNGATKIIVGELTEVVSELTEVVSELTEVVSELTEVVSELTEVVSELTEVVSELTKVVSELTEFVGALSSSWPVMSAR